MVVDAPQDRAACRDIPDFLFENSATGRNPGCLGDPSPRNARPSHHGRMPPKRPQRVFDHRLVRFVQETGDASIATALGIPRSTVHRWLTRTPRPVTIAPGHDASVPHLLREIAVVRQRVGRLRAVRRDIFVLFRIVKSDLTHVRIPASDKERLLRAVDRTRGVLGLHRVLSLFGLSASRHHA
jgi:hypothetical protein